MKNNKENYTLVAKELAKELINDISGENEEWLFGEVPSKNIMIGMIDSRDGDSGSLLGDRVKEDSLFKSVPSLGVRFRLDKDTRSVFIKLKGKLFYRVRPTFEQQVKYSITSFNNKYNQTIKTCDELIEFIDRKIKEEEFIEPPEQIVQINKSFNLEEFGEFELDIFDIQDCVKSINDSIKRKVENVVDGISGESVRYKSANFKTRELLMKDRFDEKIKVYETRVVPFWKIELYVSMTEREAFNELFVQIVNKTPKIAPSGSYETAIFNGGLSITSPSEFVPFEFNDVKYDYLDDPRLPALGNNCSVTISEDKKLLSTENVPVHFQHRVMTNDEFNSYVEFQKLIENPVDSLSFIAEQMTKKHEQYQWKLKTERNTKAERYIKEFQNEIDNFGFEIKRFLEGISLLRNNSCVREAFELMNRTFSINSKGYKGWRMFQIVFIVSLLKDMVNCEYKGTPNFICNDINNVDLIYFPTGGGKTETFLGCVTFSAFFDRIRGKNDGVTAIIKYPLRLLAAQQLDRVLDLTINANIIKKQFAIGGDDFSVGLFTGRDNTPNKMGIEKVDDFDTFSREMANDTYRQISTCPVCARKNIISEVNVEFDKNKWVLKHVCSNPNCKFELPLFIVDDEIYRFTPTFVISTIDKMANIGTSPGFNSLLGQTEIRCPEHGYVPYGKRCLIKGCRCGLDVDTQRKDPAPTLFIQDEMHLVSESLGTFDSHYESLIQYYCERLAPVDRRKTIKYIGATATISDYQSHIKNLYNKGAKKFPVSVQKENFYSHVDENDISRIIIGSALYGDSITNNLGKITTLMRIIVSEWIKHADSKISYLSSKGFDGDKADLLQILNNYLIEIIYNTSKRDVGNIYSALEDIGNNTLARYGIPPYKIAEISGDIDFKIISSVMHDIESKHDKYEAKNMIIATSSISHGVDEDCFNLIFFFGMPNKTAEYIQAFSRVGRKHTGIVFDVFRLVRDKDKSYLKNFNHYHNYMNILINPVPINRYAKNAIYSTLPGIVSALFIQQFVKNDISGSAKVPASLVTKAIKDNRITLEGLIKEVKEIYDCEHLDSKLYEDIIEKEVRNIFIGFSDNPNVKKTIGDLMPAVTSKKNGIMTSLRDVDVMLEVKGVE